MKEGLEAEQKYILATVYWLQLSSKSTSKLAGDIGICVHEYACALFFLKTQNKNSDVTE